MKRNMNLRNINLFGFFYFTLIFLFSVRFAIAQSQEDIGYGAIAIIVQSPNYNVDSHYWFPDDSRATHFFSSREKHHIGYKLLVLPRLWGKKQYGAGWIMGLSVGKTGYWLNLEQEGSYSLDPLDATLTIWSWENGIFLHTRLWRFDINPYITLPAQYYNYSVEFGGDKYSNNGGAFVFGLSPGVIIRGRFRKISFMAGIALTKRFKDNWEYALMHENTQLAIIGINANKLAKEYILGLSIPFGK